MFSMPVAVKNKSGLFEVFETLARFPDQNMMIKSGDYTVDAHSLMGVVAIDVTKPFELLLDQEPDANFKNAISQFAPAQA